MRTFSPFLANMMKWGWLAVLLLCLLAPAVQAQNWLAVKGADGVGTGAPYIDYTATDGAGNVYVAGNFNQTVNFGSTSLPGQQWRLRRLRGQVEPHHQCLGMGLQDGQH